MYIDKELVDTEHLCCMAYVRAKFVYAYEQGDDPDAKYLIDCFGELYQLEDTYKLSGLSAQEITRCETVSSVRWWRSARTCCSLLAAPWQMYRQPIIRCSQHAE